ncbi:MAG: hypothetical protein IJ722_00630 [Alloprevotella sp.]|nr:hypothetical protein [Alloprevotella sp.]
MSDKEYKNLSLKIREGLALAERRMLEEKAARNERLVYGDGRGGYYYAQATDVLRERYGAEATQHTR